MPLAQPVSIDPTLLLRVPAGHLLQPCFSRGVQQLALGWVLSLSWCMAVHLFELSKSDPNYSPNEAGSGATTELQTEGPLVSPTLPQQTCQIEKQINNLVCGGADRKEQSEQSQTRPQ